MFPVYECNYYILARLECFVSDPSQLEDDHDIYRLKINVT